MFCSNDCLNFAKKNYHQYECLNMSEIVKSASINMSLRIFFIGLSICNHDIEEFKKFIMEIENSSKSVFDFDLSSKESSKYFKNYFTSLYNLSRSTKIFSLDQHSNIISKHPRLTDLWSENNKFILNFIHRLCQISDHNFHGIFSSSFNAHDILTDLKNLQQSIGSGCLPFSSLINHSCSPNIIRICENGSVALIVLKPIEKGSQIFDCYKLVFIFFVIDY